MGSVWVKKSIDVDTNLVKNSNECETAETDKVG